MMMDYNLPIMVETSDARARRRLTLIAITLATIPCYCIGWIALVLVPDANQLTPTPIQTTTSLFTPTGTLQIPTLSLTPLIITGTVTPTSTPTATPTSTATATLSVTPFQPTTNTNTPTATPSRTQTLIPSATFTPTFTATVTGSPTPGSTSTPSFTPVPSTFTATPTPSITTFPTTP